MSMSNEEGARDRGIERAQQILGAGIYEEPEEVKQTITDILTDLWHLCDDEKIDFYERLAVAQIHHEDEVFAATTAKK